MTPTALTSEFAARRCMWRKKDLQLARNRHTGGNPVAAENYLQHAEHYFRLIATAQAMQLKAQNGDVRAAGYSGPEDLENDDESDGLPGPLLLRIVRIRHRERGDPRVVVVGRDGSGGIGRDAGPDGGGNARWSRATT